MRWRRRVELLPDGTPSFEVLNMSVDEWEKVARCGVQGSAFAGG